jgi:hypothetical protein
MFDNFLLETDEVINHDFREGEPSYFFMVSKMWLDNFSCLDPELFSDVAVQPANTDLVRNI